MKITDIRAGTAAREVKGAIKLSELNAFFDNYEYKTGEKDISEVTYFVCIKTLSESLGKLNNKVYRKTDKGVLEVQHPLNCVVGARPNPYMSAAVYNATVEFYRNHYGNAFVWIQRGRAKDGKIAVKSLYPLNPEYTTILIDNKGLLGTKDSVYIRYVEPKSGQMYIFDYEDVLHYRSSVISSDGLSGMPIRDILASTIKEKKDAQGLTRGVYKNGVTGKAVLEYVGDLNKDAERKLINQLKEFTSGEENYGSIIPIPLGMKLTPLNISLADVQFLDIKKYSSLEIASAFGIKPNQLNNYEKSSYSNSEAQNLSFYVDTLLYILNAYEQEDSYKLLSSYERTDGYYLKRNVNAILRGDIKSQTDSLVRKVSMGIMTVNEARRQLDLYDVDGGDKSIVNGTYIDIKDVGEQYDIEKEGGGNE